MKTLRRWQIDSQDPYCTYLAADARLRPTDYHDDQVWELLLGGGESTALALQTRYGGRAGLVSLVPMWIHEGRPIYQAQAYAKPPYITGFAPGYLRVQATLTSQLALQAEYWSIESHVIGMRFALANAHTEPTQVRFELVGFVGMSGKEQRARAQRLADQSSVLWLGEIGNLRPAVVAESGQAEDEPPASPKLTCKVVIEGRKKAVLRVVHAGASNAQESLALAQRWLNEDWTPHFERIETAASAIPVIETGSEEIDAAIAFSSRQLMQSFLQPTDALPHHSFVATRQPERGFNLHDKGWSGQGPPLAYLTALATASIDPEIAQGVIRNYLAVQQPDGWIDSRPGLDGQKQNLLCMPILARLAWGIFQYTEDDRFLKDVFPGLLKFFLRWLKPDRDKDGDGVPEWQSEDQTGYVFAPILATWQGWGSGADIQLIESPDLVAYLLSEARSLKEIAYFLREAEAEASLETHIHALSAALDSLWDEQRGYYVYRDRDTHKTLPRTEVIQQAHAGESLLLAEKLSPPNRLIIRVSGGVNLTPRMTIMLDGLDQNGQAVSETASSDAFVWAGGRGVYTSQHVFSQIDRVTAEGLSRVYRLDIHTMDSSRLDINGLLPLWSTGIPVEHVNPLLSLLTDPHHFWRSSGISMNSAQDANFDPANANGSGGVWPFWLTLMGEALMELGEIEKATELVRRFIKAQVAVLKEKKSFTEFYHSDQPLGLGESGNIGGIVPLHLLLRVFGIRIISSRKVWAGGTFHWDSPVTVRQRGVIVRRSQNGTVVIFPSGYKVEWSGVDWREVVSPHDG
jgi:hypothetical protein